MINLPSWVVTDCLKCESRAKSVDNALYYVLRTSVSLMMIHFVTPTKDRPNHRCSKNHMKSCERDLAKTKKFAKSEK